MNAITIIETANTAIWPIHRTGRRAVRPLIEASVEELEAAMVVQLATPYAGRNSEGSKWGHVVYGIAQELAFKAGADVNAACKAGWDRMARERNARALPGDELYNV